MFDMEATDLNDDIQHIKDNFSKVKNLISDKKQMSKEDIENLPEAEKQVVKEQQLIDELQNEFEQLVNKNNFRSAGLVDNFNTIN